MLFPLKFKPQYYRGQWTYVEYFVFGVPISTDPEVVPFPKNSEFHIFASMNTTMFNSEKANHDLPD